VDSTGVESIFSEELLLSVLPVNEVPSVPGAQGSIELLQNKPNPADEATIIAVAVNTPINYKEAYISICDLNGKEVNHNPVSLDTGVNEVTFTHGFNMAGVYIYSLVIDGKVIKSRRMVFSY
jgi:hypothetical protein